MTLENNMSEAWGVLSHLNAVMNNAETRELYQSLLPVLSEYYTAARSTYSVVSNVSACT